MEPEPEPEPEPALLGSLGGRPGDQTLRPE
eukprot:COSAG02_NODE_40764_length_401_cov_2.049669_1_plen_29_part_01